MRYALIVLLLSSLIALFHVESPVTAAAAAELQVGFGAVEITPKVEGNTVYMAGFGHNRKATGVHDPLFARAVVLQEGNKKIALVSVDLVGFFYPNVLNVRKELSDFHYVLVSSTHNHEGPDSLGIWGPSPFKSGVDPAFVKDVEAKIVAAARAAEKSAQPATATIGKANGPELLHDGREPYVKHDELVVLRFTAQDSKPIGLLVQWNCHPETMGSKNTLITADYVGYTVDHLQKKHGCPVAYFTGTVGGLMTSLDVPIKDDQGKDLKDGTYEKTEKYGLLLGELADKALAGVKPLSLTPLEARSRPIFVPMVNRLYHAARWMKVMEREAFMWKGDPYKADPEPPMEKTAEGSLPATLPPLAIRTELALLRLGDLEVACIPGEIYPELVLGKVQDPVDPAADYPDAPVEPAIYQQMKAPHRMMIGLANDEIGYIIPKRQWDEKPPFCYGRKKTQYGEVNSIGPDAAPILCNGFKALAEGKK